MINSLLQSKIRNKLSPAISCDSQFLSQANMLTEYFCEQIPP
jgi:hypothetical protein